MNYKNAEGYSDPTAGQAIANAMREERRRKKQAHKWRKAYEQHTGIGQRYRRTGCKGLQAECSDPEASQHKQVRKSTRAGD